MGTTKPPSARRTKSDSSSTHATAYRDREVSPSPTDVPRKTKDLLGKRVTPTVTTDSRLKQKPYEDRSSVQSKQSQVSELKITTPGSWPKETSLYDTDTQSAAASSSSSRSLATISRRSRKVSKNNGTVNPVTRISSRASQSTGSLYAGPSDAEDADKWFYSLRRYSHSLLCNGKPRNPTYKPVRVAVLDSGFVTASDDANSPVSDHALRRLKRGHVTYKDFTGGDSSYTDNTRLLHGTWCASLLMQTAPNADLYVANVVRPGKTGQKAEHVAAAIAWAIENEVDIISMSFGWANEQEEVDEQIYLARSKGILLFAAASNDGDLGPQSGSSLLPSTRCVASTHAPDWMTVPYSTPGPPNSRRASCFLERISLSLVRTTNLRKVLKGARDVSNAVPEFHMRRPSQRGPQQCFQIWLDRK